MIRAFVEKGPILTGCLDDPVYLGLGYVGFTAHAAFEHLEFPAPDLPGILIVRHGDSLGGTCIGTRTAPDTSLGIFMVWRPRELIIPSILHGDRAYSNHIFTHQGAQSACNTFVAVIVPFVLEEPWLLNAIFSGKFSDYLRVRNTGQKKFQDPFAYTFYQIGICFDLQPLSGRVVTGGHEPHTAILVRLHQTNPA